MAKEAGDTRHCPAADGGRHGDWDGEPAPHGALMEEVLMRKFALVFAVVVASFAPRFLDAHEGHAHKLTGTVTAVHADINHVELRTKDGKSAGFYVTPTTKYVKGARTVALSLLAVGTRVVVTTKMEGEKTMATEVRLGGTTSSAKAPAPHASPHH